MDAVAPLDAVTISLNIKGYERSKPILNFFGGGGAGEDGEGPVVCEAGLDVPPSSVVIVTEDISFLLQEKHFSQTDNLIKDLGNI
jgi:hypothetical protein